MTTNALMKRDGLETVIFIQKTHNVQNADANYIRADVHDVITLTTKR